MLSLGADKFDVSVKATVCGRTSTTGCAVERFVCWTILPAFSRGTSTCWAWAAPIEIKTQTDAPMTTFPTMNAVVINKPRRAGKQLFTGVGGSQLYGGSGFREKALRWEISTAG